MSRTFKQIADEYFKCKLDTPPDSGFPEDIKEGGYRWKLYVYSGIDLDYIDSEERDIIKKITSKFRIEHLIFWTRENLKELYFDKIEDLQEEVSRLLQATDNFKVLRILIYLDRILDNGFYCVDEYMLEVCPWLSAYVVE